MIVIGGFTVLEWLVLAERELLLFAGVFLLLGAIDEFGVDLAWLWLKATGRARTGRIDRAAARNNLLAGKAAVLIPAWREAEVIGATIAHALQAWPQQDLRLYVGCYRNDPATAEAVLRAAGGDTRLRLVIHGRSGPTTKADCLNRLYHAIEDDERRTGESYRMVVLHDAGDMVDPAALGVLDAAIKDIDFIQLPVRPEPRRDSFWIAGHYCDEFAEVHAKVLVVRDALTAGLPAAGVGCAFSRTILGRLTSGQGAGQGPFSVENLTQDYELGMRIKALGGRARFLRMRGEDGRLVATRASFPTRLGPAVRQKTRWIHGMAFQGWDRSGWSATFVERWMRLRDRRWPMTAIVLAATYLLLVVAALLYAAQIAGLATPWRPGVLISALLVVNCASFLFRAAMRFGFTAREYGFREGLRAVLRIPLTNMIAILAGRRALFAYLGALGGARPAGDKTGHPPHPAGMRERIGA